MAAFSLSIEDKARFAEPADDLMGRQGGEFGHIETAMGILTSCLTCFLARFA